MNWFAAHAILLVRYNDGRQDDFPLWENIYLFRAMNFDDAIARSEAISRERLRDTADITCDGRPARLTFVGLRKVIEVEAGAADLYDGVEVSFSSLEVRDADALRQFVSGEAVTVMLDEVMGCHAIRPESRGIAPDNSGRHGETNDVD